MVHESAASNCIQFVSDEGILDCHGEHKTERKKRVKSVGVRACVCVHVCACAVRMCVCVCLFQCVRATPQLTIFSFMSTDNKNNKNNKACRESQFTVTCIVHIM